jgi:hypothetical protein
MLQQTRARRRKRWLIVGVVIVSVLLVGTIVYVVTLPPQSPFHELWSKNLAGNPGGQGAGVDGVFVTYSYVYQDQQPPSGSQTRGLTNLNFSFEGIDPPTGGLLWSVPLFLHDAIYTGPIIWPWVIASGSTALLVVTWSSPTETNLTVLSVDASTGRTLGEWSMEIPEWAALPIVSEGFALDGVLTVWFPDFLVTPTPLEVYGLNITSGEVAWNDSLFPPDLQGGWGTSESGGFGLGPDVIIGLTPGPSGTPGTILDLNVSTGHVMFQKMVNTSTVTTLGAITPDGYYFLQNSSSTLDVTGFNLTTGQNTTPIPVTNVADFSLFSAQLFAVGRLLVVASYSPSLSYAAYDPNGTMAWRFSFPDASSCGQPQYEALGPCATDLSAPMQIGNNSVLLSSYASAMAPGNRYVDTFRIVSLTDGSTLWSASYSFTFGQQFWPWQSPVPGIIVETTVGDYIVYSVVVPNSTSTAGGAA